MEDRAAQSDWEVGGMGLFCGDSVLAPVQSRPSGLSSGVAFLGFGDPAGVCALTPARLTGSVPPFGLPADFSHLMPPVL